MMTAAGKHDSYYREELARLYLIFDNRLTTHCLVSLPAILLVQPAPSPFIRARGMSRHTRSTGGSGVFIIEKAVIETQGYLDKGLYPVASGRYGWLTYRM